MLEGQKIFLTGAAGVIGTELTPMLLSQGAQVLAGDLKKRPEAFPDEVQYLQMDLNELELETLRAFGPTIIIHLAATFERSTESYGFWDENFNHNVKLSHHIMSLARKTPSLRRVVFASSYLIYDENLYQFESPQVTPCRLNEQSPLNPRNLTGMAKLAHEKELTFLQGAPECHFSTLSVRIFRGYGRNSRDVISRWIRSLLGGEAIKVFRPEGMFDYLFAADSAKGLMLLASRYDITGAINLGTGRSRSVSEVVSLLQREFPDAKVIEQESDILFEASEADIASLEIQLSWKPEYTLETAIPLIIEHEKHRLNK